MVQILGKIITATSPRVAGVSYNYYTRHTSKITLYLNLYIEENLTNKCFKKKIHFAAILHFAKFSHTSLQAARTSRIVVLSCYNIVTLKF